MSDVYFLVFGIIVTLVGIGLTFMHFRIYALCTQKTAATIKSLKMKYHYFRGMKKTLYCPEFEYTIEGKKYEGTASFSTYKKDKYRIGDMMNIYIDPADPGSYRFEGRYEILLTGILALVIGLLFVVLYFY